jgi:monofunctional biosynthetic peptidoglycan transglycosylase
MKRSIGLKLLFALFLATLLPVIALRWIDPPFSAFMARNAAHAWWEGRADYRWRYRWVNWDRISPHAKLAVIAAEDQLFPEHVGFDFTAISKAWDRNQDGKRPRGASTISQQVAKNLFLWPGRSYFRKGIEAYFTALIELFWPKRRILEVYLNVAEFGDGIYGVAAAGESFFRKSPSALTPAEAALIAAVLPNPIKLRADRPSAYTLTRQRWILRQMRTLGGVAFVRKLA